MKKRIKLVYIILIIGIISIISGLVLLRKNINEDKDAKEKSDKILKEIKKEIKDKNSDNKETSKKNDYITINGYDYSGIISLEKFDIVLPVSTVCDTQHLKSCPCIYSGSSEDGKMVIAAHAFKTHFGKIKNLKSGDTITFEDMDGKILKYEVVKKETLNEKDVSKMVNTDYELTLFTCTLSGDKRVTIRAKLIS